MSDGSNDHSRPAYVLEEVQRLGHGNVASLGTQALVGEISQQVSEVAAGRRAPDLGSRLASLAGSRTSEANCAYMAKGAKDVAAKLC